MWISTNKKPCLILLEGIIKASAQSHILQGPSVNEVKNFILPCWKHLLPPSSRAMKHLSTKVSAASLYFFRRETQRNAHKVVSRALVPKLYAKYWIFMLPDCPMTRHPIFYQIPKALCRSKNVLIPSNSHSLVWAKIGALHAPSSHYSISSFREPPVMCQGHKCTDLLSRDFPLTLQTPTDTAGLMKSLWHLPPPQQSWPPSDPLYTLTSKEFTIQ